MTRGFWQDEQRYLETYWSRFKNVWVHGDWAAIDEDGLWYILGRSDDTIKVGGKRIGPAEVESVLVNHPAVNEAAAIGVPHEIKGNEVVCFCILAPGFTANDALRAELRAKFAQKWVSRSSLERFVSSPIFQRLATPKSCAVSSATPTSVRIQETLPAW